MAMDIDKLKKLADAATPGPWCWGMRYVAQPAKENGYRFIAQHPMAETAVEGEQWEADAAFIAASREMIPALIEEVERLQHAVSSQADYSIDLQRIIEDMAAGRSIREPKTTARHHYQMAVKALALSPTPAPKED